MRARTALAAGIVAVTAAGSLAPAVAGPTKPKPIKERYGATTTTPDPTPITGETGGNCSPTLPGAKHEKAFALPFAGILKVDLHSFQGDWALAILDKDGEKIADHDNDVSEPIDTPSSITLKFKKATTITVRACNFAGGPTATVDLLYTSR